ncbi:Hsp90 protein-domain-containing protein [Russula earlei]|uniref:Hsp90 protein-domain-containing protein n=1 Tax=Russula earlei TaxID=71964 RepID=A0ACC0UQI7_9AGAM|nr:Hsp90 protein-domain-containing protein [Russula earlei]
MAPPHPLASIPPPLPPGWTEHVGPANQIYFFNTFTKQSTYVRPLPALPATAPAKEKPKLKTPIPGTDWLRVTTNQGNVFYTNKAKKESVWTIPDEIKDAVQLLDKREEEEKLRTDRQAQEETRTDTVAEQEREIERIRKEIQGAVKRTAEDFAKSDEIVISKRPRMANEVEDKAEEDGTDDDEESEEEDWQREAAEQLSKGAEEEKRRQEEDEKAEEAQKDKETAPQLTIPDRVDLSIEEGKALFKTLLREKDVNPLHPWDTSLPLFISDPRYVLLPSVSARREAFDEYCRERAREIRASRIKKEKEDPKQEFETLLTTEVKSTRMSWTDFRRQWKKDRRFYGWGRDDREREKRFREFLRELGERKRALAQKAEADFFALLRESGIAQDGAFWKEAGGFFVKKRISDDPRYDAVGSSSLREELFNTLLSAQSNRTVPDQSEKQGVDISSTEQGDETRTRKVRNAQAVKEREERVKAERERVQATIEKSRIGLNREEGELQFRTLLTDAIREPQALWETSLAQLRTDPRFQYSPLPVSHRRHLFEVHVGGLRAKHLDSLHAHFLSHSPSLATEFAALPVTSLLSSLPATKLGFDVFKLEDEFGRWQRTRTTEARKAFDDMLHENSFVEFWGRLSKLGGEGADGGVKRDDDDDDDEGEAGGGNVDMKKLAKSVDITEMEKVLKGDKRYTTFDHVSEQRERWLRVPRHPVLILLPTASSLSSATRVEMRILRFLVSGVALVSCAFAQDLTSEVPAEKHHYQSDVARLRKIVINSLYSHRDIFLRELISNANDALEKLRLTSLTHKGMWDGAPLNITIKPVTDTDGSTGRLIITDNGIGMTPDEMTKNLGTLAKSGTAEFLAQAEGNPDSTTNGNLIGSFGLGFYSSFLVADQVYVASVPAQTPENPDPQQYIFSSSSDDNDFATYPDPRGKTLERGTEITLVLKPDAAEYLNYRTLVDLVNKHSVFSSSFPIYLFKQTEKEVPEEPVASPPMDDEENVDRAEDEAIIEEVEDSKEVKKKTILVDEWDHINSRPSLWTRDPKNITTVEYELFYKSYFLDFSAEPIAWNHFSGDLGSGVSFRALLYVPGTLPDDFWRVTQTITTGIRLLVKRTFITSDFGEDYLPKWASWVKAIIDADDLPLNVSRETLQNTSFIRQIKQAILKRIIQTFTRLAEEEPDKFAKAEKVYGTVFKLGAVEDTKNRDKLIPLIRFVTNQRNSTSLDQYVENKKAGQKQIFYVSDAGKTASALAKSVFVEKLHARGYEVLLLTDALDEILLHQLRKWKGIPFQDAAKVGLQFGDEDLDPEKEKTELEETKEKFKPLLSWLKIQAEGVVRDVVISDRLVTSPCAIVADASGYTANVQRIMRAQQRGREEDDAMFEFAKRQKVLELNPRSPLIEGLLRRVEQLHGEDGERDLDAEDELREVTAILLDGALVRSGFEVPDSDEFLIRVDRVLRRSLGVSETAPTDTTVKPAPPVDPKILDESEYEPTLVPTFDEPPEYDDGKPRVILSEEMKEKLQVEIDVLDDDDFPIHDEL